MLSFHIYSDELWPTVRCDGKVLQPASNQYNITEKIKEANQKLFTPTTDPIPQRRLSSQRVRFKDKLVEYESEEHDKPTMDDCELRIESVEEEYEYEESIEIENFDEKIEEISIEIEELKTSEGAEVYDENDFELESHPIVEGDVDSAAALSAFERPKRKRLTTVVQVMGIGGRMTPQSESSVESELKRPQVVKNCCQYKESNEYKEKLPKYNGMNSRYGLSKEEIERRESGRTRREQVRNVKQHKQLQQKELVARINEEVTNKFSFIH